MGGSVILADDHPIMRQGMQTLLAGVPGIRVIAEVDDGLEAVRLVERLKPDVLIVDAVIPGLNGLEVTRRVTRSSRQTRVILFSRCSDEAHVAAALRSGALGYVLKVAQAAALLDAVREVSAGRIYLSPPLSAGAIEEYLRRNAGDARDPYDALTNREREVLPLAAEGHSTVEIALRLSISPRTVEKHRAQVMQKLALRSQTDLVRFAMRRGIVALD